MLRLKNIAAGYHASPVIYDINYTFEAGKVTALIGPNGSGKSTLLKAVAGVCDIYGGNVFLTDQENRVLEQKELFKQISYLPQSHFAGAITVSRLVLHGRFPHLKYPRRYSDKDYEYCYNAMEQIGILPLKDKTVEELSGGQIQKVYIAMALAGDMDVYLFDEPTTYLDIKYQMEVLAIMKNLSEQGKTVIVVLHDLNYALQTADEVLILEQGKLVFAGKPNEVMESKMIDRVFQVRSSMIQAEDGRIHLFMEREHKI